MMDENLLDEIEVALKIQLSEWQRNYLLKKPMVLDMRITGRATGKTLVWIIDKLFESEDPLDLRGLDIILNASVWWSVNNRRINALRHPSMGVYRHYLRDIYEALNEKGIKTREVIFK